MTRYEHVPMRDLIGSHDIVWIVLDSLRFDVAETAFRAHATPNMARLLPRGWELRHAPGTYTLPSHVSMFAGFLPTPAPQPKAPRLFSARMPGADALHPLTFVFDEATIPEALAARGYRTVCIGGVGFFSKANALGSILPSYFQVSHWKPHFGPGRLDAVSRQVEVATQELTTQELTTQELATQELVNSARPILLYLNVAATHHPTRNFVDGATKESTETQLAALRHTDSQLQPLVDLLLHPQRRPTLVIVCSDHGDAFGEDGYWGHRLAHPTVLEVPYAHAVIREGQLQT